MTPIAEFKGVDARRFAEEIRPLERPAVLRGLVAQWPAVTAGRAGPQAEVDYLLRFRRAGPIEVLRGPPEIEGRFHYAEDLRGFNFDRGQVPFEGFLRRLLAEASNPRPAAYAMQSATIPEHLPGFVEENPAPLPLPAPPRIWIGNALKVATHFDLKENVACCMAGRRRFTVFPPEQTANLYVGPLEITPAGVPVSMVHLTAPDFARYPRFREALAAGRTAELGPGDALYLPYHWWHHVESLDPVSVLVNWWWNPARTDVGAPSDVLLHAMLSLRALPDDQRRAWRAVFDHYVFQTRADPAAHLPPHAQGVLGEVTPAAAASLREKLKAVLRRL